ncbi:MAG: hypothetical protein AABX10_02575 [Nanoarchaeota archaeon]
MQEDILLRNKLNCILLAKLHTEEVARCKPALDRLTRRHQEILASLDKLVRDLKEFNGRQ